jgi:Family of unknown function (DUF6185)
MLALLAGVFLVCTVAPTARAQSVPTGPRPSATWCALGQLGSPAATAEISFTAPYTDQTGWSAKLTVTIPASWERADDLLMSFSSQLFQRAYSCLFPPSAPAPVSVGLSADQITMLIASHGPITSWSTPLPWPFRAQLGSDGETVAVSSSGSGLKFRWTEISVSAKEFTLVNAAPLPASDSDSGDAQVVWTAPSAGVALPVWFTVTASADPDLGRELAVQSARGLAPDIPYDVEEAVFAITLTWLLMSRKRGGIDNIDSAWRSTRRLCALYAILSSAQVIADIVSQFLPSSPYPAFLALFQVVVIGSVTFYVLRDMVISLPLRRALMILLSLASAGAVFYDFVLGLSTHLGHALRTVTSGAYPVLVTAILSFFYWLLPLASLSLVLRKADQGKPTKPTKPTLPWWLAAIAGCLALVSAYFAATTIAPQYELGPVAALTLMTCLCVVIGVLRIAARNNDNVPVADRHGQTVGDNAKQPPAGDPKMPLVLDSRDRWLVSVGVSFAMLIALPQTYLGVRLGLVAAVCVLTTYLALRVATGESLVWLAREKLPEAGELPSLQQRLVTAGQRLAKVAAELKPLDGAALAGKNLERRNRLEAEQRRLRSWQGVGPDDDVRQPGTPRAARSHGRFEHGVRNHDQLAHDETEQSAPPAAGDPLDLALAFGPFADAQENLLDAVKKSCVIALIPLCVAAVHDIPAGNPITSVLLNPTMPVLIAFLREAIFWLAPLLLLAVGWSSFFGRRGPARALQAFACVAVPLGCDIAIILALHQTGAANTGLRCAAFLACLVILGVWFDISTLRRNKDKTVTFSHGYLRLSGLVATLTLIIPLATAILGIWLQVDSGALTQKATVTPTQSQLGALVPAPAHSAAHASAHSRN